MRATFCRTVNGICMPTLTLRTELSGDEASPGSPLLSATACA